MSAGLKDLDRGFKDLMRLKKYLKEHRNTHVKAGVMGGEHSSGVSNVEVATWNEFGTSRAPERSFIRSTFDAKKEEFYAFFAKLVKKVTQKKLTPDQAFGLVGEKMAAEIKKTISLGGGVPPPNAPSTIAAKGSSHTLIDTGQMMDAVTYQVTRDE